MKARILILIIFATFLTGCVSNNLTNINITSADLIGTWNLTSQTIKNGNMSLTTQGQNLTATYSAFAKNINFTFIFSEAPNKLILQGTYIFVTKATILGQNRVNEEQINTDLVSIPTANWSLNGNSITLTESHGIPAVMSVEEFSSNRLLLKGQIDETMTFNGDTVTTSATIYITLEK